MDPYHAPMARISLGSLAPPDVDAGTAADPPPPPPPQSCLLDSKPFFGKRINDTTATLNTIDPDDEQRPIVIQATLFVARAPGVSYVLAWATGTRFTEEPLVLSTHGGFVLLSMAVRLKKWPFSEYYIYHPGRDQGGDGHPELCRIEQPNSVRLVDECCAVGLISHGGGYSVAALAMQEKGEFQLYIFSSETRAWTIKKPVLSLADGATDLGDYMPDKAIAVGGGGAMAFVDLWNGILFCNVLDSGEHPELCYLRLPSAELCRPHMNRLQPRDIAFDMSSDTICIRFVEVVCPSFSAGWHASTWTTTTMATSPWRQQKKGWQQVTKLYDHELLVADGVSTDGLLPEVSELADTAFGNLLVDMPMLSLHENNIICFLAKHHIADSEVWAIAVDMETKKLKGVNLLQVGRCTRLFYSTISSHLNMTAAASGERECPKRPGTQLESYPHKKQQQLSMVSSAVGEQEQEAMGALDGDEDNV